MERLPENPKDIETNFAEVGEQRRELRKAISELGIDARDVKANPKSTEAKIFDKHYKTEAETLDKKAGEFRIADFRKDKNNPKDTGLSGAKEALRAQKKEYVEENTGLDYEAILAEAPEIKTVQDTIENISDLKDFRMRRMLETLNPNISLATKKRNEAVLKTVKTEIDTDEARLEQTDPIVLRQAEIIEYKENLAETGHICITPNVERDLEAIGARMLTGKPMFLHGPTGTGKTSLARFAAEHFTGKTPEMVFCNPQTRESNVWGKTGIRPARDGAIETVEIYGPLAKAMIEGKTVIFDEFTALPKEQMVFIKGVFNAKVGDQINIVGNGLVEIAPGFQMIFTANLKSEKNPERQDLPPEIAREFEQNNLEVKYTKPDESYDIMLARLLNRDGTLDMSYFDLNNTLPNLCKAMAEIQESYTNETDKEVAKKAGAMDASGKVYSLKKFVMTQGSVEAILSSWAIEKATGSKEKTFAEFLDERLKTALTFKEYSKEDRVLVAKILASKGFLLTLNAKDLDLPEDIFTFNTIKAMRGEDAVEELRKESGAVKHLSLKDVALLDPFNKRAELLKGKAEALLSAEDGESDQFLTDSKKRMEKLFGKKKEVVWDAEAVFTRPDGQKETIYINFDAKLQEFVTFYSKNKIDLPADFEDTAKEIFLRNVDKIEKAIAENGFDDIMIIPGNIPLPKLAESMKMENGYNHYQTAEDFSNVKSQGVDMPRILLVHHTDTLSEIEKKTGLKIHLDISAGEVDALTQVEKDKYLSTLEDFMILEKKYFEETGKHLSDFRNKSAQWLPGTHAGARLVDSCWNPDNRRLYVSADGPDYRNDAIGLRPSRCFL